MGGANNLDEIYVFLRNMFNDKAIMPISSKILRNFVSFMIASTRSKKSRKNYELIGSKSPLLDISKSLQNKLNQKNSNTQYFLAMRYTSPFATQTLKEIKAFKPEKIIFFPLYPHYSFTTVLSSLLDIKAAFKDLALPTATIEPFFDNQAYLDLTLAKIAQKCQEFTHYEIVFSAHGLPMSSIKNKDPYYHQILRQKDLLEKALILQKIPHKACHLAFQSRFGKLEWLRPYLKDVLEDLGQKPILIVPISFVIDNLETLFELKIEYKELATNNGCKNFEVLSCHNDDDSFADFIYSSVSQVKFL